MDRVLAILLLGMAAVAYLVAHVTLNDLLAGGGR